MNVVFEQALLEMEDLFSVLVDLVPAPVKVPRAGGFVFRYEDQTIQQAIVQRIARSTSTLRVAANLVDAGYLQETGTLQRALDDFAEDITFLSLAVIAGDVGAVQQKYLDHFYAEVIPDPLNPMSALDKRPPRVQRREICDEIARQMNELTGMESAAASDLARAVSSLYCSFVHGGSPQIMEMYGGVEPHYSLRGIPDSPLKAGHVLDLQNQFFRTALAYAWAARALGADGLDDRLVKLRLSVSSGVV